MTLLRRIAPGLFVILWATGFIGARYAMPWTGPFLFLFVRFVLAFAILAMIIVGITKLWPGPRQLLHAMFAGCLIHGVYLGGVFWAIKNGLPAGLSALIVGLQPLFTAFLAAGFLGDRIAARQWAGLATGLAGVALVLMPAWLDISANVTMPSVAAAFIAVAGMSAGTIWQKRHMANTGLLPGTAGQYLGAAMLMGALSFLLETPAVEWNGELVFAMAWLVIVLSIGAVFLLMLLIREGEVARVASLFYLVPAVTALMAWALFSESLDAVQLAGMVVASAGVAVATRKPGNRPPGGA